MMMRRALLKAMLLSLPALGIGGTVLADDADIFEQDHYSVICVVAEGTRYSGETDIVRGTAFFLNEDGIAITNSHVALDSNNYKQVRIQGLVRKGSTKPVVDTDVELTVIARDTKLDLALLKSNKPIPSHHVHVADLQKAPTPGTGLTVIGCPPRRGPSLDSAKISNVVDDEQGRWLAEGFINPGMSGSPAFNRLGRVVGIISAGIPAAVIDGKTVPLPFPPGIVTPFSMAEASIIKAQNVKVSRGNQTGSSPPLILAQDIPFSDRFSGSAWASAKAGSSGPGGGGSGGGGPLASIPGAKGGDPWSKFPPTAKPGAKPAPILGGTQTFEASPGYQFLNADIASQTGNKSRILGTPDISPDRKKITVRYEAEAGPGASPPNLNAVIQSLQVRISPKPAQIQKIFNIQETNALPEAPMERSLTYQAEQGYRFASYEFQPLSSEVASEPRFELLDEGRKLLLNFSLGRNQTAGKATSWLAGTIFTTQALLPNR